MGRVEAAELVNWSSTPQRGRRKDTGGDNTARMSEALNPGSEISSQAILLDSLARCNGMYGALLVAGQSSEAVPPPPPATSTAQGSLPAVMTLSPMQPLLEAQLSVQTYALAPDGSTVAHGPALGAPVKRADDMLSAPTERAKRKKLMRQGQKDLLVHLDSILHLAQGGWHGQRSSHKNIIEATLGEYQATPRPAQPVSCRAWLTMTTRPIRVSLS